MSIIQLKEISFTYDSAIHPVFEKLDLVFDDSWKLGLIGRNGMGKTTLMKILAGQLQCQGIVNSTVEFSYFPIEVENIDERVIDIFEGKFPQLESWVLHREVSLLDMDSDVLYRPFRTLSGGEKTKLLLAFLFSQEDKFRVVDEPTNHLDLNARAQVLEYLKSKSGFILASHDRTLLDGCCDHILSLNPSGAAIEKGNYSSWKENMNRKNQYELEHNDKLKKDIIKLSESARRSENWSHKIEASKIGNHVADRGFVGRKAADMMRRSKNIQSRRDKAVDEKKRLLRDIVENDEVMLSPTTHHSSELLRIENMCIQFSNEPVIKGFDLNLKNGEIIALSGKNGSGKTSILKAIIGEDVPFSGELWKANKLKIAYLSQGLDEVRCDIDRFIAEQEIDKNLYFAILRKLGFSREQFEIPMDRYSAGQKKKAMLSANLCKSADLYVWDEPLNYIDLDSRLQVEDMIIASKPSMILVEHDRMFLQNISANIVEIS